MSCNASLTNALVSATTSIPSTLAISLTIARSSEPFPRSRSTTQLFGPDITCGHCTVEIIDLDLGEVDCALLLPGQIDIKKIRTDGGTQPRDAINDEVVIDYGAQMQDGILFPPVIVFFDGTDHWLADGFHRVRAALLAKQTQILADIRQGTRRDAILHSVGANAAHGLRRSNADKRRAVETLLRDDEWKTWSNAEVAKRCGVSDHFVGVVRREVTPIQSESTSASPKSSVRKGADGRTINTANIGKSKPARRVEPADDGWGGQADEDFSQAAPEEAAPPRASVPVAPKPDEPPPAAPARAPAPQPAPEPEPVLPPSVDRAPPPITGPTSTQDAKGAPLTERQRQLFTVLRSHAEAVLKHVQQAEKAVAVFEAEIRNLEKGGPVAVKCSVIDLRSPVDGAAARLRGVAATVKGMMPHVLCDQCDRSGGQCGFCEGSGWLSEQTDRELQRTAVSTAKARMRHADGKPPR